MRARAEQWLRARGPSAAAVLLTGMLACTCATLAPMLARSIGQATLRDEVHAASKGDLALTLRQDTFVGGSYDPLLLDQQLAESLQSSSLDDYYQPMRRAELGRGTFNISGRTAYRGQLAWVQGLCRREGVVRGRCPTGPDEVAMSARDARAFHQRVGDRLRLRGLFKSRLGLRVVGIYPTPAPDSMIARSTDLDVGEDRSSLATDYLLVSQQTFNTGPTGSSRTVVVRRDLRPGALTVDSEPSLRAAVDHMVAVLIRQSGSWDQETPVLLLLDRVDSERRLVALTLPIVGLQVVLIVWVGLALLVRALSMARSDEWALAKLRGFSTAQVLRVALGGPALLLLVAAPLGLALSVALADPLLGAAVGVHVPVDPWQPAVLAALGLAVAGSLVALVGASWQALRSPVSQLLHRSAPAGEAGSRVLLAVETVVVVVAALGVWQLTAGTPLRSARSDGLGLFTPALLAVAAGVVVARLASYVLARGTGRLGSRPGGLLATRRLAHSPGALRVAIVVVAGAAVATSAVAVGAVAATNRHARAGQEIGADRVLTVSVPAGASILDLVRRADPGGRHAMAVLESKSQLLASTSRILAVDVDRYPTVARVDPTWTTITPTRLVRQLRPPGKPPVRLTGSRLTLRVSNAGLVQTQTDAPVPNPVHVVATVDDGHAWQSVDLGELRDGVSRLTGAMACPHGCRLVRIEAAGAGRPFIARFNLLAISTDRQPAATFRAALTRPGRWRSGIPSGSDASDPPTSAIPGPDGLTLVMADRSGQDPPTLLPRDVAFPLPAVAGSEVSPSPAVGIPGAVSGLTLDGDDQPLHVVGVSHALPRLGSDGVLVDLQEANLGSDPAPGLRTGFVPEVWLTSSAPPSVLRSLRHHGVRVLSTERASTREQALGRAAPARASTVATAAAAAALLLSVLVGLAALLLGARRRLYELAALRVSGVRDRDLVRSVVGEVLGLLGGAALVGAIVGRLATAAILPGLPLYADHGGPPRDLGVGWPTVLVVPVVVLLVLAVASLALGTLLVRGARPDRLREGLR